jgi:hypothetical protein
MTLNLVSLIGSLILIYINILNLVHHTNFNFNLLKLVCHTNFNIVHTKFSELH